jgi:hypothetical protein
MRLGDFSGGERTECLCFRFEEVFAYEFLHLQRFLKVVIIL